jgi:hypothetical protein
MACDTSGFLPGAIPELPSCASLLRSLNITAVGVDAAIEAAAVSTSPLVITGLLDNAGHAPQLSREALLEALGE